MSRYKITDHDTTKRLDVFVAEKLTTLSRSAVQKLIEEQRVTVNNEPQKTGYKLKIRDHVKVDFDSEEITTIPHIELPVIYEDEDCVVINKPAGVLTHSKGVFNPEATVASFIKDIINFPDDGNRDGIVHRLDRGTSGVIICAKNPASLSWLQKQFSQRRVKKTYMAIIDRPLHPEHAIIDIPIERNPKKPQTFRVGSNGKPALTEYRLVESHNKKSLVELRPQTGRTHQLRVHLVDRGCPIVGDTLYGGTVADRMYLHAQNIELTLPNRKRVTFTAELPKEFREQLV